MIQHARRLLLTIGLAAATVLGGASSPAMAQVPYFQLIPQNSSKYAAIVVDAKTGEVLYGKRADAPRYPASITKVMTLYLAFEALAAGKIALDDPVVFSPRAAAQAPTKLGVRAGDSITVQQAMEGMVTRSANDAAVAMAEKIGGTEQRFAALRTRRAQELGMVNTTFANPHGLPDSRNISTARDLAILSRAVMRDYPQYYRLFSTKNFAFRGQNIRNHHGLLYTIDGMGGPTAATRNKVAESLLLTGFDVLERRAHGEQITVAQNFFEPAQLAEATQTSMQQGDTERGLSIQLASSPPPSRASKIQIVEP